MQRRLRLGGRRRRFIGDLQNDFGGRGTAGFGAGAARIHEALDVSAGATLARWVGVAGVVIGMVVGVDWEGAAGTTFVNIELASTRQSETPTSTSEGKGHRRHRCWTREISILLFHFLTGGILNGRNVSVISWN